MAEEKHHGLHDLRSLHELCSPGVQRSDRFGRIFPDLAPLYVDPTVLAEIGEKDGPMQSNGAAQKTTSVAVGQVFFGQFIDHDITLDVSSSFARLDRPSETENLRTPVLDLDCIYGDGPEAAPFMYWNLPNDHADKVFNGAKLLTGADVGGASELQKQDLARSVHGRAIIGDPRNDENRIISQLQLAMIRFHNKVVEKVRGTGNEKPYEEARRIVTWHYQWVVLNDFLPAMVGAPLVADILSRGRRIYRPEDEYPSAPGLAEPFIPVEFSVAAYRFGHSMIPQQIQIQAGKPALDLFGPTLGRGFTPLSSLDAVVQWKQVLDLSDSTVDRADKLDSKLAADLFAMQFILEGSQSLATRNLLRGQAFRLPSGEAVAEACDRPQNEIAQVTAHAQAVAMQVGADLRGNTPLWLYVLAEGAEIGRATGVNNNDPGEGLGPVAGRIVAETLIGLMELDPGAFLGSNRSWSPDEKDDKLGTNGVRTLLDMLTF